jgi:hypothetical protein
VHHFFFALKNLKIHLETYLDSVPFSAHFFLFVIRFIFIVPYLVELFSSPSLITPSPFSLFFLRPILKYNLLMLYVFCWNDSNFFKVMGAKLTEVRRASCLNYPSNIDNDKFIIQFYNSIFFQLLLFYVMILVSEFCLDNGFYDSVYFHLFCSQYIYLFLFLNETVIFENYSASNRDF